MYPLSPSSAQAKSELLRLAEEDSEIEQQIRARPVHLLEVFRMGVPDVSRYQQLEDRNVAARRRKFDIASSRAFMCFQERHYDRIPLKFLVGIAKVLAGVAGLTNGIDRDAKREKYWLFYWLECHWERLDPLMNSLMIEIEIETIFLIHPDDESGEF
jgi:hypothetical protein